MPVSWLTWCYLEALGSHENGTSFSRVVSWRAFVAAVAKPNSGSSTIVNNQISFSNKKKHKLKVRKIPSSRKWQSTPVFLPGEFMDREAWWAAVHEVTKSWTWLCSWAGTHACGFERVIKWKMRIATYEHIWSKTWGNDVPKSKKNRYRVFVLVLIYTEILRVIEEIHETVISCFISDPMINKLWCKKKTFGLS